MFNPISLKAMAGKVGAIALLLAVFAATVFVGEASTAQGWAVASIEGTVSINGQAAAAPAAIGPGSVIETGADGNVVLSRPGDSITVFPNSRMTVPASAEGAEPGILQSLGKLLFRMESRESRDFEVKTPYLAAAIKGTTFTVEVDDNDAQVEVEEGSVLVTANRSGQSAYVGPGERATVSGDNGDSVKVSDRDDDDGRDSESESDDDDGRDDDSRDDDSRDDDRSDDGGKDGGGSDDGGEKDD